MANMNILRGGYKQLTMLLRPYSTVQSSFMGRNSVKVRKTSVLFTQNALPAAQQPIVLPQATPAQINSALSQIVRASSGAAAGHMNHTTHWTVERYLAIALLAIIPGSIIIESSITDYILAASLVLHAHWGLQSILTDYVHGATLPKMAQGLLYICTALTFAGLCYFNYSDVGMAKAIKKIWSL